MIRISYCASLMSLCALFIAPSSWAKPLPKLFCQLMKNQEIVKEFEEINVQLKQVPLSPRSEFPHMGMVASLELNKIHTIDTNNHLEISVAMIWNLPVYGNVQQISRSNSYVMTIRPHGITTAGHGQRPPANVSFGSIKPQQLDAQQLVLGSGEEGEEVTVEIGDDVFQISCYIIHQI